ncbi:zinc-dependent alcohol dehydrogenase family protein [bacterium]|nr:zinc-dependent alcohol dehydrogenase family protein [bacterium]
MRAMQFNGVGSDLQMVDLPLPQPVRGQVLIRVSACGICRTDLHIIDGELDSPNLPLIPGHQIVGVVEGLGPGVDGIALGERVGVPWLGGSCGHCDYCSSGRENLCDDAVFTGYQVNGGFAEHCVADARFCFPIPGSFPDLQAAPLLCAGLIGHRAHRMAGQSGRIGLYGFGAAAHIMIQVARHLGQEAYAFTRPGDAHCQRFALELGASWAGGSDEEPPELLDNAVIFAPAGELVPQALRSVRKGGRVVCAGIHMSDIPSFPYSILWGERSVMSVANLTRQDGEEFMRIAAAIPVHTHVTEYTLGQANEALEDLRLGRFDGAAVLRIS